MKNRCLLSVLLAVALLLPFTRLKAQTNSAVYIDQSTSMVVNRMPFPFEVLLVRAEANGTIGQHRLLRVEAASSASIADGKSSRILDLAPLDPRVEAKKVPNCESAPAIHLTQALAREELQIMGQSANEHISESASLAAQQGSLQFQQTFDSIETQRNDPMANQAWLQQWENSNQQQQVAMAQQEMAQTYVDLGVVLFAGAQAAQHAAGAYADAAEEEAGHYKDMLKNKEAFLKHLESDSNILNEELTYEREFSAEVARQLKAMGTVPAGNMTASEFGRLCSGAAAPKDTLALVMNAPGASLIAKLHFDHGGDETVIFRRIQGTSQWLATIYWPLDARSGTVELASGKGVRLGTIQADRPSMHEELAEAKKSIDAINRKYKEMKYRGQGGDDSRTTITP